MTDPTPTIDRPAKWGIALLAVSAALLGFLIAIAVFGGGGDQPDTEEVEEAATVEPSTTTSTTMAPTTTTEATTTTTSTTEARRTTTTVRQFRTNGYKHPLEIEAEERTRARRTWVDSWYAEVQVLSPQLDTTTAYMELACSSLTSTAQALECAIALRDQSRVGEAMTSLYVELGDEFQCSSAYRTLTNALYEFWEASVLSTTEFINWVYNGGEYYNYYGSFVVGDPPALVESVYTPCIEKAASVYIEDESA